MAVFAPYTERADCSAPDSYSVLCFRPAHRGGSVAELGSALRSAAGEDLAAVRGGHSLAEAVLFLALTLLGLIGTQHVLALLSNSDTQHPLRRSGGEVVDKKPLDN